MKEEYSVFKKKKRALKRTLWEMIYFRKQENYSTYLRYEKNFWVRGLYEIRNQRRYHSQTEWEIKGTLLELKQEENKTPTASPCGLWQTWTCTTHTPLPERTWCSTQLSLPSTLPGVFCLVHPASQHWQAEKRVFSVL